MTPQAQPPAGALERDDEVGDPGSAEAAEGPGPEAALALERWSRYEQFRLSPGHKCPVCWLMLRHCCCAGLDGLRTQLRPRVLIVMHADELGRHQGSNTAKLLVHYGAELVPWGVGQDEELRRLLREDPAGCVVLFPSPDAIDASALAAASSDPGCVARSAADLPRSILVLDGGWRECKKINGAIDAQITRCRVTTATREEYGGTRKYGTHEKSGGNVRVQTAAAFIALMQELGEDPEHVTALKAGLAHFMGCWEAQICRSKTWVT